VQGQKQRNQSGNRAAASVEKSKADTKHIHGRKSDDKSVIRNIGMKLEKVEETGSNRNGFENHETYAQFPIASVPALPTHHSPVLSPQLTAATPAPGPAALSSDELKRLGGLSDHYAILGIKDQATEAEIKKSYRGLALKYHPDKTGGRPDATAVYSKIAGAYEILSDPEKRAAYDDEKAQPRGFGNLFNRGFFGDSDFFDSMSSSSGSRFGKTTTTTTKSSTRNGSSTKTTTTTYSYSSY
jgi:hypothetical protein